MSTAAYTTTEAEAELRAAINTGDPDKIDALAPIIDAMEQATIEVTILAAALYYAEQGLKVFPIQPGLKIPHPGTRGCKDATTDPEQIRAWWDRWPNSNLAIATGHLVDVVDIDGAIGQKSRCDHWDDLFGRIDDDAIGRVLTPRSGGMHLYVPAQGEGNSTNIVPSVDYRGKGGYVLAPPSQTEDGSYRWLGQPNFGALAK